MEVAQPTQLLQPKALEQVEQLLYVGKPVHVPAPAAVVQPGQRAQVCDDAHDAHVVKLGTPEHVGAALNWRGGGGSLRPAVRQQICPVQSSFFSHDLAQVLAQIPLQQS